MDSDEVHHTPTATRRSNGVRPFVSPRGPAGAGKSGGIPKSHTPAKPFAPQSARIGNAFPAPQVPDGSGNVIPDGTGGSGAVDAIPSQNNAVDDPASNTRSLTDRTEPVAEAIQPEPMPGPGSTLAVDEETTQLAWGALEDAVQAAGPAEHWSAAQQTETETETETEPVEPKAYYEHESASDSPHVEQGDDRKESMSPVDEHSGMFVLGSPAATGGTSFDWDPGAVASIEVEGDAEMIKELKFPTAYIDTPRANNSLDVLHEELPILEIGSLVGEGDSVEEVVARSLERVAGRVRSGSLEIPRVKLPSDEESALIAALSALRSSLGP